MAQPYDGVYLVGGTVRDILLGRPNFDVDVAVEGDAIEFARALANDLGGRCHPHGQFGTAVVHYGEGKHVDAVTARREVVRHAGRPADGRARRRSRRISSAATSRSMRWPSR